MTSARWTFRKASAITIRPPLGSRACAAMADSSSDTSWNGCCDRLHPEGLSGGSEGIQVIFGKWRRCRVEQEGDPPDARGNLLEQLQPLAGHRRLHSSEAGYIAAWPRQTRDEATADWIDYVRENDGDSPRLLHHRQSSWCVLRKNEVGRQRDELLREPLPRLRIGRRPTRVDSDVSALHPPELLESVAERCDPGLSFLIARVVRHQHADPPHPIGLRARRERPRGRTADKRDECAAVHSITSSAAACSVSGTVRPSALAVLRLITSSNVVGCSTGSSDGLAPLRIRPA